MGQWGNEVMKLKRAFGVVAILTCVLTTATTAQQGGGRGGRGGLPGATPEQTQAVGAMNAALADAIAAVASARMELARAALADVKNAGAIRAGVEKLQAAEVALATRRASEFARLQAGSNKLNADQISALMAAGGGGGPAGGGRGGRGGAPDPNALSVVQQMALAREMAIPAALTAAQAAAASALVRASLTTPLNQSDVDAKARALADAELALADARAAAFERVQKSLQPLNAAQVATYAAGMTAGGGGGGRGALGAGGAAGGWEAVYNDHTGFTQLFDGKTLTGWDGEAGKWDIQDGAIHRHQTLEPKNFVDFGQYHIHYNEVFSDFDLKVEFKIRSGNAGIQYRGRLESGIHAQNGEALRPSAAGAPGGGGDIPLRTVVAAMADPLGKPLPANIKTLDDALAAGLLPKGPPYGNGTGHPWQVSGYQFDIYDSPTGNTGSFYEGQGRGVSANTGEVLHLTADANNNVVKTILGRTSDLTGPQYYKQGEWNQVEIIARGNTLIHMLNGRVFCVVVDDDPTRRALKGIISLQLEGPADNEVWYRNVWIRKLQ